MSIQLRRGQSVNLNQLARDAHRVTTWAEVRETVEVRLGRNDLTALAARFGGK